MSQSLLNQGIFQHGLVIVPDKRAKLKLSQSLLNQGIFQLVKTHLSEKELQEVAIPFESGHLSTLEIEIRITGGDWESRNPF